MFQLPTSVFDHFFWSSLLILNVFFSSSNVGTQALGPPHYHRQTHYHTWTNTLPLNYNPSPILNILP